MNYNIPMSISRLVVVNIQHFRDNLFVVQYENCYPIISDDISISETALNFNDFKVEFIKFLRARKLLNLSDDKELIYNSGEIIYSNLEYIKNDDYSHSDLLAECFKV